MEIAWLGSVQVGEMSDNITDFHELQGIDPPRSDLQPLQVQTFRGPSFAAFPAVGWDEPMLADQYFA